MFYHTFMREWWGIWGISGKFVGINYALLPNCEWNQKQKHKKQPFSDATALPSEGGVGDVAWLIQASASNHKPKGRFFWLVLHGRDAILRVRDKLLISNTILQLWADVKYHVPTRFGFSPKASGFYVFVSVPPVFLH